MPNLSIDPSKVTFSQIHTQFADHASKSKGDDASLRLSGTSLHTKNGWLSGTGSKAATKRAQKKTDARDTVDKAVSRELMKGGMNSTKSKELMTNLRQSGAISGDRVTIKDLDTIRNSTVELTHNQATKQASFKLNKFGVGAELGPGLMESLRMDGKIPSADQPLTMAHVQAINKAVDALVNQQIQGAGAKLSNAENAIRQHIGVIDSPQAKLDLETHGKDSAVRMAPFEKEGMGKFSEANVEWAVSEGGKGGVIFAKDSDGGRVALKFDGDNIDIGEGAYKILDGIRKGIPDDPLPFLVPNMTVIDLPEGSDLRTKVDNRIDEQEQSLRNQIAAANLANDKNLAGKLQGKLEKLIGGAIGTAGMRKNLEDFPKVMKFEMINGAQQMNKLDPMDKMALVRSEQFAQNLGKSMVILQFLGFNDHANMGDGGLGNNVTNFSNFMVDHSGNLHLIDPSMYTPNTPDGSLKLGSGTDKQKTIFQGAIDLLAMCQQGPDQIGHEVNTIFQDRQMGIADSKPLTNVLAAVFKEPGEGSPLFYSEKGKSELPFMEHITDSMKQTFTANLMQGMAEGLAYLDRNRDALANSIDATNLSANDTRGILDDVHQNMSQLNLAAIQRNLEQYKTDIAA